MMTNNPTAAAYGAFVFNISFESRGDIFYLTCNSSFSAWERSAIIGNIPVDNSYHHVAICYDNATVKVYIDGILKKTSTGITIGPTGGNPYNMIYTGSPSGAGAKLDEVLITSGIRYTSNFTPPSNPYTP